MDAQAFTDTYDLTNGYGLKPSNSKLLIRGQAVSLGKKLKIKKASYVLSQLLGGHSYTFVSSEMDPVANWLK